MTEPHWKEQTYWISMVGALVVGLALASFVASLGQDKKTQPEPITYKLIIEHAQAPILTSADLQQQAIYPVRQGKRSEPGVLSPEMIRAIENQAAKDIFSGKTSQSILDGPPGLDAPWKVKR